MSWTQDEAIAFECAKEAIGHLIAIQSNEIYKESQKENPDVSRIEMLDKRQTELVRERKSLRIQDQEKIAKVRVEYGAIIRAALKKDN